MKLFYRLTSYILILAMSITSATIYACPEEGWLRPAATAVASAHPGASGAIVTAKASASDGGLRLGKRLLLQAYEYREFRDTDRRMKREDRICAREWVIAGSGQEKEFRRQHTYVKRDGNVTICAGVLVEKTQWIADVTHPLEGR